MKNIFHILKAVQKTNLNTIRNVKDDNINN